jgi:putative membrane protein insertion efficiency factor
MKRLALALISFYRSAVSPYRRKSCRFLPTCSEYTYEAIDKFGLGKGVWLGIKRFTHCHPFHAGGYDPVP